ncbi:MAG TPA: hypothetical protein VII59_15650 [Streptosporangiaceae bacterium]
MVRTASGEHRVSWSEIGSPEVTVELHRPSSGPPALVAAAAALAGPGGTTRTSVTGLAIRTGYDRLDLAAVTRGRDLREPELR